MDDKEKVAKGGIFSDAQSYVAAASGVLPIDDSKEAPSASEGADAAPSRPLPSLSVTAGKRLWIGNLDSKISEFHLLKLFKQFGTIVQLDFLFHKGGPLQGQPRGYAFISYDNAESAERARQALDGKWAVGKRIAVKYASATRELGKKKSQATEDAQTAAEVDGTTLKDLPQAAKTAQIRAIEAKLSSMGRAEQDFTVNPEIKRYQSMKNERKKPYSRGK